MTMALVRFIKACNWRNFDRMGTSSLIMRCLPCYWVIIASKMVSQFEKVRRVSYSVSLCLVWEYMQYSVNQRTRKSHFFSLSQLKCCCHLYPHWVSYSSCSEYQHISIHLGYRQAWPGHWENGDISWWPEGRFGLPWGVNLNSDYSIL